MSSLLETIELQTHDTCEWSVIWMHGLGADGSDFVPVVPELGLDPSLRIRFVFPNAPVGGRFQLWRGSGTTDPLDIPI